MTSYFTHTATADTVLLIKSFRAHDDLAVIAASAERDVISHFTRRYPAFDNYATTGFIGRAYHKGNGVWVALDGFNPDASQVTDADFVIALRETIADVINWRLSKAGENIALQSSGTAGTRRQPRDDIHQPFPPGNWTWRLKVWDRLMPLYSF